MAEEQKDLLEREAMAHEEIGEEELPFDVGARVSDEFEADPSRATSGRLTAPAT